MNTARLTKVRALAITAVGGLLAGAVAVLSPAQATEDASNCKSKRVTVYPGDKVPPRLRLGEVNFDVTVCPTQDAAGWSTQASAATNGTGNTIGYLLESAALRVNSTAENSKTQTATYTGSFTVKDCVPLTLWPCARTHRVEVGFALIASKKSGKVSLVYGGGIKSTMPRGMALYRTP
ncbi:hypothetical protein [Streptomyces sp. NPDC000351]|uniref:hypothetical protein n=1 Tax=Streptomyces sp. NPDC000351 TaxID=3154250 RepID=UPI003322E5C6